MVQFSTVSCDKFSSNSTIHTQYTRYVSHTRSVLLLCAINNNITRQQMVCLHVIFVRNIEARRSNIFRSHTHTHIQVYIYFWSRACVIIIIMAFVYAAHPLVRICIHLERFAFFYTLYYTNCIMYVVLYMMSNLVGCGANVRVNFDRRSSRSDLYV